MIFSLSPEVQACFATQQKHAFDQLMHLKGEVYRSLENRCTQRIILENKPYFIKQHFGVGWKEIIKNIFQLRLPIISSKNEWLAIQKLQTIGISTQTIKGYGCRGWNPAALSSFLLTEELPLHITLEELGKKWQTTRPTFAFKVFLIKQVAQIARTMHDHGMNHRDFYLCHFLLDAQTQSKLYLIDLHRAQIREKVPQRWRIKDLAGLYFSSQEIGLSKRDYLRFMREYRNKSIQELLVKESAFWQKVKQRGDKLYRQHAN